MIETIPVAVATVGDGHYAVPIARVIEVALRVRFQALAGAPPPLLGYLVHRGQPIPVVDLRRRFDMPPSPPRMEDHVLIVRTSRRPTALLVDRVDDVQDIAVPELTPTVMSSSYVQGVVRLPGGMLWVADVDAMLSLDEERAFEELLTVARGEQSPGQSS